MNIPSICLSVCLSVHIHHQHLLLGRRIRPSVLVSRSKRVESPSRPVIIAATSTASYRDERVPTDRRIAWDRKGILSIHPSDVCPSEYFVTNTVPTLAHFHCCPTVRITIILRNTPTNYRDNVCLSERLQGGDITVKGCYPTLFPAAAIEDPKDIWTIRKGC